MATVIDAAMRGQLVERRHRLESVAAARDDAAQLRELLEDVDAALARMDEGTFGVCEVCVCFFVEVLGTNQPKISRHLAYLRRAGVVAARREGKWMHYRVATPEDEHAARVFAEVMKWLGEDREMQKDRVRLENFCCAPRLPVRLQGAPRPAVIQT